MICPKFCRNRSGRPPEFPPIVCMQSQPEYLTCTPLTASSIFTKPCSFWDERCHATRNWLALGLLLAAWNAADCDDRGPGRPDSLRGYSCVSVRAAQRAHP